MEDLPFADHTSYTLQRIRFYDSGIVQSPVAGAVNGSQECALIRLYFPIERLTIVCTATRTGKAPVIPHPNSMLSNNAPYTLITMTAPTIIPVPIPGGKGHEWCLSVTYVYARKKPQAVDAPIYTGAVPGDPVSFSSNNIPMPYSLTILDSQG